MTIKGFNVLREGDGSMLRFDDFRLDVSGLRAYRGDALLDAPPQVVEVLVYLIRNAGRIVPRTELLECFWPRAGTGGDAALNTCIRRMRSLLDDDADAPRYIQTRPRVGYRFIGTLSEEAPACLPQRRRFTAMRMVAAGTTALVLCAGSIWAYAAFRTPQHRIAVEPVQGMCEYVLFPNFNTGLRESLVARMSRALPKGYSISVDPAGADLHARVSVRQTPQRTVVVLNLVDDRNGRLVWSGEFAEPTDTNDYVPLQGALADRMASGLLIALEKRS